MTLWQYVDQMDASGASVTVCKTEAEILAEFYPHWCEQMRKAGKADQINEANCIGDWVVVHWASRVRDNEGS